VTNGPEGDAPLPVVPLGPDTDLRPRRSPGTQALCPLTSLGRVTILLGGTWGSAQRFYSIGKAGDAKKAALPSTGLYLIYPLILYIPVWAAQPLLGELLLSFGVYCVEGLLHRPTDEEASPE